MDLGGQWVHGEEGNVAFELANPLGLLDKSDTMPNFGIAQEFLDSLGNPLNDELTKEITNFYFKYVVQMNIDNSTNATYESVGEYVEKM